MIASCVLGGMLVLNLQELRRDRLALQAGVPRFDENLEARLIQSSPAELEAYARQLDGQSLLDAYHVVFDGMVSAPPERLQADLAARLPVMGILARVLADRGYSRGALFDVRFLRDTPLAEIARVLAVEAGATDLYNQADLGSDVRYHRMTSLADSVRAHPSHLVYIESRLVELAADAGLHERKLEHLERSITLARQQGRYPMLSQLLGTLCDIRLSEGDRQAALALADEALEVALAARIPMQAGRVYYILAADHARRGELGLASEYYDAATEVARELDGRYSELRFLVLQLRFQAGLGCWDLVGRNLPRIELLARNVPSIRAEPLHLMIWEPATRLHAAYMNRVGDFRAADSLYAKACDLARQFPRDYVYARCVAEWSDWLVGHDQPARGIDLARDGLAYADTEGLEHCRRQLLAVMARGHLEQGDLTAATRRYQDMLAAGPPDQDEVFADAILGLRLAAARRDRQTLRQHADAALAEMVTGLRTWGPRLEMYLMLHGHDFFRELLHQHFVSSVDDGLALELAWSGVREYAHAIQQPDLESFLEFGRQRSQALRLWCHEHQHRTLLFAELGVELGCWTLCGSGTRYQAIQRHDLDDVLATLPAEVATAAMADALPGPELQESLQRAASLLLPDWCFDKPLTGGVLLGMPPTLKNLPLEALDLDPGPGYVPLASRHPVAYMSRRGMSPPPAHQRQSGSLVVAVPRPSEALLRAQPSLRYLPRVQAEARRAQAALPDADLLTGTAASKPAVLDGMAGARFVYIAGHATQDPDMPYRTFLPCAVDPTSTDVRDARLELSDILARDLSGCELVVLSNCRSGSGRTTRHTVGPSLADAFADAGAQAVIATRWPLEDSEASEFMAGFVGHWGAGTQAGAWTALNNAQREGMGESLAWLNYRLEFSVLPLR